MSLISNTGMIQTGYSKSTSIICDKGKGKKRAFELISSLALLGPSTTSEVEEFVLKSNYYQKNPERKNTLRDEYNRIIQNRFYKKSGGKKTGGVFPGLIKNGYVLQTGEKIIVKSKTRLYFLTLKGCFFVLGFKMTNKQLISFINNASRNHLFFYFLKLVCEKISLDFVKEIFVLPIQDLIQRKRIDLVDQMYLNFGIIADEVGIKLYEKRKKSFLQLRNFLDDSSFEQIEELRKLIIYDRNPRENWYESIIEYYYSDDNDLDFYLDYSEGTFEMSLLNKVMYQLLHGYHEAVPEEIPDKTQVKIPRARRLV